MPEKAEQHLEIAKSKISSIGEDVLVKLRRRIKELEAEREKLEGDLGEDSAELRITEKEEDSMRKRVAELSSKGKELAEKQKELSSALKKVSYEIENLKKAYSEVSEALD